MKQKRTRKEREKGKRRKRECVVSSLLLGVKFTANRIIPDSRCAFKTRGFAAIYHNFAETNTLNALFSR